MPPNIEQQQHDAEANPPFPIEYGDDDQEPNDDSANLNSANDSQSHAKEPGNAGPTFLSRLSQLPIQRPLPWRAGQELPLERSSDSDRVQQRGASLLATRGNIASEPCTQCAAGRGRFSHCISLGNWFQGACSSCVFTSRGNRCTLRLQRGKVDGRSARHQPVEDGGMNENPNPRAKKRKRKASEKGPTIPNLINEPLAQDAPQYTSAAAAKLPQALSTNRALEPMMKTEVSSEDNELLSYVHNVEKKQKRYASNGHVVPGGFQGGIPRYQEPLKDGPHRQEERFTAVNGTSTPYNAGTAAPQKIWPRPASRNMPVGAPLQSSGDGGQPAPLIDTLPKSKQRQIFGLISGLQGGIDHLQKQLTLLQSSLGIEVESNEEMAV